MAKDWTSHNERLFEQLLTQASAEIEVRIKMLLSSFAYKVYDLISSTTRNTGDGNLPFYTGNLRDSTGLGLYYEGSLIKLIPPKKATKTQNCKGYRKISGSTFIQQALSDASAYPTGLWVVLYSTIPYAVRIETFGSKYWDSGWFSEGLVEGKLIPQFKTAFAKAFPELASQINV